MDALQYLAAHDAAYANLLDLRKLVVTGFPRWGKAALLAGFLDDRFPTPSATGPGAPRAIRQHVIPGANLPVARHEHIRHQTHNSNEMIRRFLPEPRIYQTTSPGYGDRLPFDHHMMIASIAPWAVLINNTNDDYADNGEGDSISYEGANLFSNSSAPHKTYYRGLKTMMPWGSETH